MVIDDAGAKASPTRDDDNILNGAELLASDGESEHPDNGNGQGRWWPASCGE